MKKKVRVEIDENSKEPEVIIRTDKITDEVHNIIQRLSDADGKTLYGFKEDVMKILDISEIIRIYSAIKKVFAQTKDDEYVLRMRLYELESRLDVTQFVRISKSEILNLRAIKKFDFSITGTIAITLSNGTTSYASRRYVANIKKVLGM
ncbi:MAG: LytTR family transcriptional regulator DNA-binding domain-containing protein [Defluviitaleaceae bacterium]|nr:LytTR family transcriptional regulator DNA-binding domain-containing protein [Defluviitaleaceae bacterium]